VDKSLGATSYVYIFCVWVSLLEWHSRVVCGV